LIKINEKIKEYCKEEYKAYTIYASIAKNPLIPRRTRLVFEKASIDERRHYEYWRKISGECVTGFLKLKTWIYVVMLWLFGITVVLKLMELGERKAQIDYKEVESLGVQSQELKDIIRDEEEHEEMFVESINEGRIKYLSSIALGITDALVELTGIYTGSLGAFASALSAGLIGLIAGVSASVSMGVASYTQAKHAGSLKPALSALYTMIAYFIVASLLALPYFIFMDIMVGFSVMITIAILVVAYMSFYVSVLHAKNYAREFLENSGLILGIAFGLYIIGSILRQVIGIPID
jgi:VIT1/CCC1 family predicted Fe2+/Mn2+ transporter